VKKMSENEQKFRLALSQLNAYEQQAQVLEGRIEAINQMMEEIARASAALDELKNMVPDQEILVSLGAGTFLKARVAERERVVFQVGAGVVIEKSVDEVKAKLSERQGELQKSLQTTAQQLDAIVRRARELNRQVQDLAAKISEERGLR